MKMRNGCRLAVDAAYIRLILLAKNAQVVAARTCSPLHASEPSYESVGYDRIETAVPRSSWWQLPASNWVKALLHWSWRHNISAVRFETTARRFHSILPITVSRCLLNRNMCRMSQHFRNRQIKESHMAPLKLLIEQNVFPQSIKLFQNSATFEHLIKGIISVVTVVQLGDSI